MLMYLQHMGYVLLTLPTATEAVHNMVRLKSQVEMMVPKRLKDARKSAGLSQEKLLQLTYVDTVSDKSQVSNYESGKYAPPYEFIVQVAKALDYPETYFYALDDVYAETLLQMHRNKTDPAFNPYIIEVQELKKQLDEAKRMTMALAEFLGNKKSK